MALWRVASPPAVIAVCILSMPIYDALFWQWNEEDMVIFLVELYTTG